MFKSNQEHSELERYHDCHKNGKENKNDNNNIKKEGTIKYNWKGKESPIENDTKDYNHTIKKENK